MFVEITVSFCAQIARAFRLARCCHLLKLFAVMLRTSDSLEDSQSVPSQRYCDFFALLCYSAPPGVDPGEPHYEDVKYASAFDLLHFLFSFRRAYHSSGFSGVLPPVFVEANHDTEKD